MKAIKTIAIVLLITLSSCSSITVYSDFEKDADFSQYNTYAFHKKSIDKVQISELDKKRILKAIDYELGQKGMIKSGNPDILVNIFTKEREEVNVNQFNNNWGWGFGWGYGFGNPWGGYPLVSSSVEGTLFIDFIDTRKNELVWQGEGVGYLTQDRSKKEIVINEFVAKILMQYPPVLKK